MSSEGLLVSLNEQAGRQEAELGGRLSAPMLTVQSGIPNCPLTFFLVPILLQAQLRPGFGCYETPTLR